MFDRFTPRARQVIIIARKEADRFNHNYIGTEHILLALIKLGQGVAVNVLRKLGLDFETIRLEVEKAVGSGPETKVIGDLPLTSRAKKVIELAVEEARNLNHSYVGTEHLLLGLLSEGEGVAARILKNLEVDIDEARREILKELEAEYSINEEDDEDIPEMGGPSAGPAGETPALKAFGRDLTELARKGKLDPVIGRSEEIERVIQILCRRNKNNPVLIGEAGVGKTAIAEGLAQEIVEGNVPEILQDKKLITLDIALMIAGTKYRGQFEERIKAVMDEIKKAKDILLFIDELHTIVGAGAAEGAIDASNILKPSLARGELQCVGATTLDEYRKYIEKDAALERRFQSVMVEAPSIEETVQILSGLRFKYEVFHNVEYTKEALEAAAKLSDRYIPDRFLPDKAIDVLDEVGAKARITVMTRPDNIKQLEEDVLEAKVLKEEAISNQEYEKAASMRDMERENKNRLEDAITEWKSQKDKEKIKIGEDDIAAIIAKWTGVPISQFEEKESARLLRMEEELKKRVVGQDDAVNVISKALRRSRADLKDPMRPIGSFVFLGPTGVGKTLLAKALAEFMFGNEDALIQIDMSEYMEKFVASRLTGSPPGYVGYEEGGQLTEQIRRKPYSVVLFDEVEKAHPDVMNLLLQVLEEGKIKDSFGRSINFRNTIIILTSNIGADLLKKQTTLGFNSEKAEQSYEGMKSKVMKETKKHFKPEFLNRIDDTIVFRSLDKADLGKIIDFELKKVIERLKAKDIDLKFTPKAKEFLIEKGFNPVYGARPLRRSIQRYVEDPLADEILKIKLTDKKISMIKITPGKEALKFTAS